MLGRRSLVLGLALIGTLLAGRFLAPIAYRIAILDPQLRRALELGDQAKVKSFIQQGADVNLRIDSLFDSPLEFAIYQRDAPFVESLLKRGARLDCSRDEPFTALMAHGAHPPKRR